MLKAFSILSPLLGFEADGGKIKSILKVYPEGSNIQHIITMGMNAQIELPLSERSKDFFCFPIVRIEGKKSDHSIAEMLIQGEVLFLRGKKSSLCGENFFDKKAVPPHMAQEKTVMISPYHV
jgi:hypothetical protein